MTVLAGPPRVRRAVPGGRGAGERRQLGRIPLDLWVALAGDTEARARYYRKVYWRGPGRCAFFLGALGSGGHGRFRAGTRQAVADRSLRAADSAALRDLLSRQSFSAAMGRTSPSPVKPTSVPAPRSR